MKSLCIALALALFCFRPFAVAQDKEAPKPAHQHELKQAEPTKEQEGKEVSVTELDAFHETLHPLVHELMPKKDFAGIRAKLPELLKDAKAAADAKLPESLASKQDEYRKLGQQLVQQVGKLQKTKSNAKFEKLFHEMHMTFEEMMGLCSGS